VREAGFGHRLFDLVDETRFCCRQVASFAGQLLQLPGAPRAPHWEHDTDAFLAHLRAAAAQAAPCEWGLARARGGAGWPLVDVEAVGRRLRRGDRRGLAACCHCLGGGGGGGGGGGWGGGGRTPSAAAPAPAAHIALGVIVPGPPEEVGV
jgi:hypothetical protein